MFARIAKQLLRQFPGVAQAEVEPLPGDGMQRLRRVAKQHGSLADDTIREFEKERKATSIRDPVKATCVPAESSF